MMQPTCTLAELIGRLTLLGDVHGFDLPVYADDPDTDRRLPIGVIYKDAEYTQDQGHIEIKTTYWGRPTGDLVEEQS